MAKKSSTGSRGLDGSKIVGVVLALLVVGKGLTSFLILPSLRREISEKRINSISYIITRTLTVASMDRTWPEGLRNRQK